MIAQFKDSLLFAKKCLSMMAHNRFLFVMFITASLFGALTEVLTVFFLVPIIDLLSGKQSFADIPMFSQYVLFFEGDDKITMLQKASLWLLLMFIVRGVLQFLSQYLSNVIPLKLEKEVCVQGYTAVMQAKIEFINRIDAGKLQNHFHEIPRRVSSALLDFGSGIFMAMTLVVYIAMMVVVSWELTIVTIIFAIVMSYILKKISLRTALLAGIDYTDVRSRGNRQALDTLLGMQLIRLVSAENLMIKRFSDIYDDLVDVFKRVAMVQSIQSPLLGSAAGIFICGLLVVISFSSSNNIEDWLSQTFLFFFLISRILTPVTQLNTIRVRLATNMDAFNLNEEFLKDSAKAQQVQGDLKYKALSNGLAFDNVGFAYEGGEGNAINDMSFEINKGEVVAIVGPSGAGKSTIIGLISRLLDPQEGRILIDGVNLLDFDAKTWRKRISIVSQDTVLFNDTVTNNICFGQENVAPEQVEYALRHASATDFIDELPEKTETMIGNRGVRLSGGQQQRLALARAFVTNPDLLILDEATSNLDSLTESAIQKAVEELSADRTTLIIAHRLSTIKGADKILVMDQGRLIDQGTHEELYRRKGKYRDMIDHQQLGLVDMEDTQVPA